MKKVTKVLAIAAGLFMLTATVSQAQTRENAKGVRFGLGISGGVTTKESPFKYGLGADLGFQFDLTRELAITATGGYTTLKADDNQGADYNFIPVKAGVKIFPQIGGLYLSTEAGAGFGIKEGSKTAFIYSGGLGYACANGFDLGVRYEGYTQKESSSTYRPQNGQFALRLAYSFKL
ncbi:porin family protein [Pedobacter hiemivivus]|uniref:Porin family protein n=1 Tax=Pedobacter hiemivivus TaxID=2530454 RepID=A0A4U1GQN5_9SPHI|nr:outer membrane beta-barrel protein [Pedobacter hiemivivus]TKC64112.1 porin family protein [Pedobacter hiemivivus]